MSGTFDTMDSMGVKYGPQLMFHLSIMLWGLKSSVTCLIGKEIVSRKNPHPCGLLQKRSGRCVGTSDLK